MRLIDKDALISAMEEFEKALGDDMTHGIFYANIAPTVDVEPCWIPCSERLPEDGVYLVYAPDYQGGSSSSKEWHDGVMFAKRKNGKWSVEHGYYSRPNCVKAWMPLPKPYEVEKDAQKAAIDEEIERAWEYAETD